VILKRELNDECITYCNDALEIDHRHVKALYLKDKAFINKTEYIKAADVFKNILDMHSLDVKKLIKKTFLNFFENFDKRMT